MPARVSEMDAGQAGGDAATPTTPNPATAMSVEEAWGLGEGEPQAWTHNRDAILAHIELILKKHNNSPVSFLAAKYPTVEAMETYARALWQEFPPMDSNPPLLAGNLPGKPIGTLSAKDVYVVHLAAISFSRKCMVCEPTTDKVLKLADEIMTDGFVTHTRATHARCLPDPSGGGEHPHE